MKQFPEMNWSGFVRKTIVEKAEKLAEVDAMKKELNKEKEIVDWSIKLQRASRSGRLETLKKKGLI